MIILGLVLLRCVENIIHMYINVSLKIQMTVHHVA